jgi:energy-coupling factor transporter ATP-binding protein EcfA2
MIYVTHDQVEAMTLGDRICVMRDGLIMQVADPLTLYLRPENIFVAGFIGSPPMNLVKGVVQNRGEGLFFSETTEKSPLIIPLDGPIRHAASKYIDRSIVFGIRPEHIGIEPWRGGNARVTSTVNLVEPLGFESIVYVKAGPGNLIAKIRGERLWHVGDAITVHLDLDKVYLFDPDTEKVIRYATAREAITLPTPKVPEQLAIACVSGDCVLYAGSGLSAQAGLPTWSTLLSEMVGWGLREKIIDRQLGITLTAALQDGETEAVSEALLDNVGDRLASLVSFLQHRLFDGVSLASIHRDLRRIPFAVALTTNFDDLLETSFSQKSPTVYTPQDTEALLTALSSRAFFILKLYGNLRAPETIILSVAQYKEAIASNRSFSNFMETLFFSRTIFFVGAKLEGIEDYLKGIKFSETRPRTHYALVDVAGAGPTWELKASMLRKKYGIEVIPYSPTEGHPQVQRFVGDLADAAEEAQRHAATIQGDEAAPTSAKGALKRLTLDNIGPFDHLELDLDPGWNILLGDNGVGKSNVLKAIAVAICGRDARTYANRLIKVGKPQGSILLETDRGTTYRTELVPGGVEAEVISVPGRPLEAEGWLAIGFPPSRMFSWDRPKGPEVRIERRPSSEDLLPLIQGVPDPRMDKLKQWLLNLDYWIKDAREKKEDWQRYERLREEFFNIIRKLTVGTKVEYGGVESAMFELKVITADGRLPLEAISQGTAALFGWVGILLQRLYEMPDQSIAPVKRFALVLIDELDAHMHPGWQQALIPLLKEIFPNIQFLATTHSPFLAVGRRASEIVRLRRDPLTGKAGGEAVEHNTMKMGVANVLTSYLFGLESPLDYDLQRDLRRKRRLSVKADLTDLERSELVALSKRLEDVDTSAMFRDPVYQRFVEEMTRRQEEAGEWPVELTKEEQERQRRLAREIFDKLAIKKEDEP